MWREVGVVPCHGGTEEGLPGAGGAEALTWHVQARGAGRGGRPRATCVDEALPWQEVRLRRVRALVARIRLVRAPDARWQRRGGMGTVRSSNVQ